MNQTLTIPQNTSQKMVFWLPILATSATVCLTAIFFSPVLLTLTWVGIIVSCIFLRWPYVSLYIILLLSPYYFILNAALTSGQLGIATRFSPIDFLTVVLLSGTFVHAWKGSGKLLGLSVTDILCLFWLVISVASFFHGIAQGYEAVYRSSRGPFLFVLYFAVANLAWSKERLRKLSVVLLVSSIILGVIGIVGAVGFLTPFFPALPVGLVGDSFTRPNYFVEPALAIPHILFAYLAFLFLKPRSRGFSLLLLISLMLNVMVLMLSVTRGFWAGMLVALVAMIVVLYKRGYLRFRSVLKIVVGTAAMILVIQVAVQYSQGISLLEILQGRLQSAWLGEDPQSVSFRIEELRAYYSSFLGSPIIGNGFGSPVIFDESSNVGFAHNQYIWLLETTGVLGTLLLAFFLLRATRKTYSCLKRRNERNTNVLFQVLLFATVIGYAVTSFSSPEFSNPSSVPLLATLLGINRTFPSGPMNHCGNND